MASPYGPAHENTRTPALSLKDGDDGKLLAHCFAGCAGADVLVALRAHGLLTGHSDWRPDPREIERRKAEEDAERQRRIELARRCWAEAGPIAGTLAEQYLRARGITCDLPPTLRFHANCWHGPTAGKVPAMVAAVSIGRKVIGVHRTYLAEPGVKAFNNSKLMLGRCGGGAVRLSGGRGPLVVAEGVGDRPKPFLGPSGRQPVRLGCIKHQRHGWAGPATRPRRVSPCA